MRPTAEEALESMQRGMPDVVICDLQMPEMNGLELVEAVTREFPAIPVILMTARGSEEIAAEALRKGAASYVPKSRLADNLYDTVNRILAAAARIGCTRGSCTRWKRRPSVFASKMTWN